MWEDGITGVELPETSYAAPEVTGAVAQSSSSWWGDALKTATSTATDLANVWKNVRTADLSIQQQNFALDAQQKQLDLTRTIQLGQLDLQKKQAERVIATGSHPGAIPSTAVAPRAAGFSLFTVALIVGGIYFATRAKAA